MGVRCNQWHPCGETGKRVYCLLYGKQFQLMGQVKAPQ